jgi:predicted nucleic acid-binding protein
MPTPTGPSAVPGRTFVDTNVFVHSVDRAEPRKRIRAQEVLRQTSDIVVSAQVMNEFLVVTTRKLATPLSTDQAAAIVAQMDNHTCVSIDANLVRNAIREGERWQLSHWNALTLAAARQTACDVVLTEDLADGADYDGIRISNPSV